MSHTFRRGYDKFRDKMSRHAPDGAWDGHQCWCDFCRNLWRFDIVEKEQMKIAKRDIIEESK